MTACHDVADSPVALAGIRRVALVGSPNAGKTSVFNHLTGLRAKTWRVTGPRSRSPDGLWKLGIPNKDEKS